jgi:uncharacterized lipoprotein YddW (UPF0748 family)
MNNVRSLYQSFHRIWQRCLNKIFSQRLTVKKSLIIAFISGILAIGLWPAPVVQRTVQPELRGTWITHLGAALMYYSTRLDDTMADLAKHQVNTLYPAVWNHGHSLFSSQVMARAGGERRNPWVNLPLPWSDVMAGLVAQAHRQQIRLIPWFEYGLMIPLDADIIKRHPDWLTVEQSQRPNEQLSDGVTDGRSNRRNPYAALRQAVIGRDQGWLNPFHPEVQQFLVDLIAEVVQRYPVDGIQLDDHFGLPIEYGYDAYTTVLYQAEHSGKAPPSNAADPEWLAWRADRLTQLMARIHSAVKAARSGVTVSLSPNAADYAYRTSLQDWPRWVELGLLDEVVVQLYRPNLDDLQAELDRPELKRMAKRVPIGIGLYTGPFNRAKSSGKIEQEVQAVRSAGYAGTSLFSWETTFWVFRGG